MFFLMLLISALGIQQASAQTGVNNNSDFHVPPPSTPQVAQSAAGSAPAVTSTPLPVAPDVPVPVSMAQNVAANSLLPIPVDIPIAPRVPAVAINNNPITNTVAAVATVTTTGTTNVTLNVTPSIPALLPVADLPSLPNLNLIISAPAASSITGNTTTIAGAVAPNVN